MRSVVCTLLMVATAMACDGPLRLEVVESTPGSGQGGNLSVSTLESGRSAGGRAGDVTAGATVEGGTLNEGGRAVAGGGTNEGGDASMAGMPSLEPWEVPAWFTASFRSHAFPTQYMQHVEDKGFVNAIDSGSTTEKRAATFELIAGLDRSTCGKQECVSFRAIDVAGNFFRHANLRIFLHPAQDMPLFLSDATFCIEPGLADPDGMTFRSTNYAQRVIHVRGGNELWIDEIIEGDVKFASEATFYREAPLTESE